MRKAILTAGLLLLAGVAHAQEVKRGNLVGTHNLTVKLEPGVTMDQFVDFYKNKVIPVLEESRPGWKWYSLKRIRGEKADMGLLIVITSEGERDKYYNTDGTDSELGKASNTKLNLLPVFDELKKLGTITAGVYTDWVLY